MLERNPGATPVVDALTYYVDLMNWLLEGAQVTEVFARGQKGVLKAAGHDTDDVNWAILSYGDGSVVSLGVSYALPEKIPGAGTRGAGGSARHRGRDDPGRRSHRSADVQREGRSARLPARSLGQHGVPAERHTGRLGARRILGPIANETRAWLDHLALGKPCALATAREARRTLEITLAIERSAASRKPVKLPLDASILNPDGSFPRLRRQYRRRSFPSKDPVARAGPASIDGL